MAVITLPTSLPLGAGSGLGQARYDLAGMSDSTGAQQVRTLGPPRWVLTLTQPPALSLAQAGQWQALVAQLRGRVNHLAAWDPARQQPLGTMRGTPTLTSTAAAGATALALTTGQAGCTLAQGDWLQLGTGLGTSQLVMVVANATADGAGALAVTVEPPLRQQFTLGTAVAWQRALAYYRSAGGSSTWRYVTRNVVQGMTLDLLEAWQ